MVLRVFYGGQAGHGGQTWPDGRGRDGPGAALLSAPLYNIEVWPSSHNFSTERRQRHCCCRLKWLGPCSAACECVAGGGLHFSTTPSRARLRDRSLGWRSALEPLATKGALLPPAVAHILSAACRMSEQPARAQGTSRPRPRRQVSREPQACASRRTSRCRCCIARTPTPLARTHTARVLPACACLTVSGARQPRARSSLRLRRASGGAGILASTRQVSTPAIGAVAGGGAGRQHVGVRGGRVGCSMGRSEGPRAPRRGSRGRPRRPPARFPTADPAPVVLWAAECRVARSGTVFGAHPCAPPRLSRSRVASVPVCHRSLTAEGSEQSEGVEGELRRRHPRVRCSGERRAGRGGRRRRFRPAAGRRACWPTWCPGSARWGAPEGPSEVSRGFLVRPAACSPTAGPAPLVLWPAACRVGRTVAAFRARKGRVRTVTASYARSGTPMGLAEWWPGAYAPCESRVDRDHMCAWT